MAIGHTVQAVHSGPGMASMLSSPACLAEIITTTTGPAIAVILIIMTWVATIIHPGRREPVNWMWTTVPGNSLVHRAGTKAPMPGLGEVRQGSVQAVEGFRSQLSKVSIHHRVKPVNSRVAPEAAVSGHHRAFPVENKRFPPYPYKRAGLWTK